MRAAAPASRGQPQRRVGHGVGAWLLAAGLAACGTTVKVVPEPLDCPVPAGLLAQRCAAPETLADGANFGEALAASGRDRDALRQCAAQQRVLALALADCNAAIARHRDALRAINSSPAPR